MMLATSSKAHAAHPDHRSVCAHPHTHLRQAGSATFPKKRKIAWPTSAGFLEETIGWYPDDCQAFHARGP
jgi:hypothetical protein